MSHSLVSEKFSRKSLQCAKIKCTCLRAHKASISNTTIFTGSSDSSSVHCTDSTTGQMMLGVLAEWLQGGVVTLPSLRAQSDRLSSPCKGSHCCQNFLWNGDVLFGSFNCPQAGALDFFSTEETCARTVQTQGWMMYKTSKTPCLARN